jgi:hypothetical protein
MLTYGQRSRPYWFFNRYEKKTVYLIKRHLMIIYVQLGVSPSEKLTFATFCHRVTPRTKS